MLDGKEPMKQKKTRYKLHEALPLPTWERVRAIVDRAALAANYRALMTPVWEVAPNTRAIGVVKADAYGHGAAVVAEVLLACGCRDLAVSSLEEAIALRQILCELAKSRAGASDSAPIEEETETLPVDPSEVSILVLGYVVPEAAAILAAENITATLLSREHAEALGAAAAMRGCTVSVHIALDTGMNRIGFPAHGETEIAQTVADLTALFGRTGRYSPAEKRGGLRLAGIFTHFAEADGEPWTGTLSESLLTEEIPVDITLSHAEARTLEQYRRYAAVLEGLRASGVETGLRHVCNTAATVRLPKAMPSACLDAVRLGIGLYGYGEEPTAGALRPAMRLETIISHVHNLLPGEGVSYGGTYAAGESRLLATLPIGYADGWLRAYSGAEVVVRTSVGDFPAPLVGRICMDQCMADITNLPESARRLVGPGTPVLLFGEERERLEALAARADTICYEVLCLVTARVERRSE